MDPVAFLAVVGSLLAISNPVGSIPTFVMLTHGCGPGETQRIARRAAITAASVLLVFGMAGQLIFQTFGITLPAFRIAGGILIFKYALDLLHGQRPNSDSTDREILDAFDRDGVAITPLGVPLLAGPGAITTVMLLVGNAEGRMDELAVYTAVILVYALGFLILRSGKALLRRVGQSGLMVVARIMGLLLAAIAVQFVITGLHEVSPVLFPGGAP